MKVTLSLDQATRITGYAIFNESDLIHVGQFELTDATIGARLVKYRNKLIELIKKYNVTQVLFEEIQLQQNVDTFKKLAMLYGTTMELLEEMKIKYDIVSSNTWKSKCKIKKTVRETEKQAAQKFVENEYGISVSQDKADAICLGYSYLKKADFDWS
jgi:Holliday junction resolvasome RuvABC endonuclease subunit